MRAAVRILANLVGLLVAFPVTAISTTSYDVDFDDDTPGLAPALDSLASTVPPARSGPTLISGDVTVQAQYPDSTGTNVLRLQSDSSTGARTDFGMGNFGGGNPIPAGHRLARDHITLDVYVDQLAESPFDIQLHQWNASGGLPGGTTTLSFGSDGLLRVTDKNNTASVVSTYASGRTLGIEIRLDMETKIWKVFVDGISRYGGTLTNDNPGAPIPGPSCFPRATPQLPQGCNGLAIVTLDLGLTSSGLNAVSVDNFNVIHPLPEPSTATLTALGLVGLAIGRRRPASVRM